MPGPAAAPIPIEIAYVRDNAINVSDVSPRATPTRPPAFHAAPSIVAVNEPFGCTGGMIRGTSGDWSHAASVTSEATIATDRHDRREQMFQRRDIVTPETPDSTAAENAKGMHADSSGAAPTGWARWARALLVLLLAWLAWGAFHDDYGSVPLVSEIDLAIHEFGHMLFMPFGVKFLGDTMMILGGSLVQVAFPLLFVGYFLRRRDDGSRRDPFAAMVCLWWAAINLLGVAIYCADSRAGQLMLITGQTGQESDGHDWNNLLTRWGLLQHDTAIAARMRALALMFCVGGLIAAGWFALASPPAAAAAAVAADAE